MSSDSTQQCMFQLKLNPLTGNSEWVVIKEEEEEETEGYLPKSHLSSTSYLDMLNDSPRNRAFREAIEKTITKPCHVLDIGAGTGLLSMMAARTMLSHEEADKGMVSACESYLPMVKLMRKILHLNRLEKKIRIFNKRSDELQVGVDLTSRADVLVSEILDSELLGEGLIPTLQHAHEKLLVKNPQTVPYRAITFGQLVECKYLWKLHDLHNNEAQAVDGLHLTPSGSERLICVKPQQYAMHCDAISDMRLLSEPFKIFEFDFWKRPDSHGETELRISTITDGRVQAVVSWWVLQLDREGTIFYSTAPQWISLCNNSDMNWCDHWKQCVWFVPGLGVSVSKDEEVHLQAVHDDTSISYNLKSNNQRAEPVPLDMDSRGYQLTLSLERIAMYGDREWRYTMFTAVRDALQEKVCRVCLVADDSVFLTILIAHLSTSSRVISLFPGLQEKGTQYLRSVANANGFSMDRVKVLGKKRTCLTMEDTDGEKVDLLVGEPFYYGSEGMLPWQSLRFWKARTMLDSVLSEDAIIMPCKGILKACAMSLPDLWKSRSYLSKIEGFNHSVVNATLGACGNGQDSQESPCLPYFIWQCGEMKKLSEIVAVMEFDFSKPISQCFGKTKVIFNTAGVCHGFALWIDWVMEAKCSTVLSTGPDCRYYKQGVKLLSNPVAVSTNAVCSQGKCYSAELDTSFNPSDGELTVHISFINEKTNL
ncbi:arginine N-methyltransferase [Thalictrum thalictroides]|uniref:Protein arginine N-methyltransferase n=1 Tax=Thalictrum thalictroides TaxID=46969 RepID=A0A7J6V7P8_THATH|nr:arginine N-methyltransferase [Thalictrum thalictroides]